jgi:hypothetical protein
VAFLIKVPESKFGIIVGIVVAVVAVNAFAAYRCYQCCQLWPCCNTNDATTEDVKEDVTGGDDLEDSQAEGDAAIPVESTKTSGDVKQATLQI